MIVLANVSPTPNTRFKLEMAISMCWLTPLLLSAFCVAKTMPTSANSSFSSSLRYARSPNSLLAASSLSPASPNNSFVKVTSSR
jgi:hypothetical protein